MENYKACHLCHEILENNKFKLKASGKYTKICQACLNKKVLPKKEKIPKKIKSRWGEKYVKIKDREIPKNDNLQRCNKCYHDLPLDKFSYKKIQNTLNKCCINCVAVMKEKQKNNAIQKN